MYSWYYEQKTSADSSLDLAFDDRILDTVEEQWRSLVEPLEDGVEFMKFEERNAMGEDDDEDNEGY